MKKRDYFITNGRENKWQIVAYSFKDAARKLYKFLGKEWFIKRRLSAIYCDFKIKVDGYLIKKSIWICGNGKTMK